MHNVFDKLAHRFELRLALLAMAALLLAQSGAVAHAYSHDSPAGRAALQPLGVGALHNACADCLGFAPLLSAAGAPAALSFTATPAATVTTAATPRSRVATPPLLAFRSRAPPVAR